MNHKLANSIFKKLNENFNEKLITNQNKAVLSSILSILLNNKSPEETDEMMAKYLTNLQEFFQDSKSHPLLETMQETEIGMFLSFIACGIQSIGQHQQATKEFTQEQINEALKKDLENLANHKDIEQLQHQIAQEITEFVEDYTKNNKGDYLKVLKIFAAYIKNKDKIAAQLVEVVKALTKDKLPPEQKKSIFTTTTLATGLATILGIGIALIGGISMLELLVPLSIGLTTSLVVNKVLTQNALKTLSTKENIKTANDKKKIGNKFKDLSEQLAKEQEHKLEKKPLQNKALEEALKEQKQEMVKIQKTLKGVLSNEYDLTVKIDSQKPSKTPEQPGKNNAIKLGK